RQGTAGRQGVDLGWRTPGPRPGPLRDRRALRRVDRPGLPRSRPGPGRRRGQRDAAAAVRPRPDCRPHLGTTWRTGRRARPATSGRDPGCAGRETEDGRATVAAGPGDLVGGLVS